uniref:Ig-like domain-containing protein n=1 Tax=Knipowitschia caucasica TaxID=637954 RepID=A0AAV2MHT0_KNICA
MKVLSPVDSGDSVNVECSVQMDAQCFEEHMVWWFGSGPDYGLVWTEKNSSAQCDSSPAPQTCFYTFSKTLNASDSGSLHCAVAACGRVLFGDATKDIVKGSDSEMKVLSPVDSGDSVNFECSVQMDDQCFEEHMVWWFGSGPDYGLVWTEKNSSAQCDSSPAPQTCFYTFSKTLNASDSGSLHCAVAACGRVLFGNATKVIVKDMAESQRMTYAVLAVFPDLPDQVVKSDEDTLNALGAAKTEDLQYITEGDFLPTHSLQLRPQHVIDEVIEMVVLLLAHFAEKEEHLLQFMDKTSLAEDVQMENVPPTPCLIVCEAWLKSSLYSKQAVHPSVHLDPPPAFYLLYSAVSSTRLPLNGGSDSEMKVLSPVDSGDSVNVECSVQMDAQCFEEHMVWWFGSGPDYGLVWTEKNSSAQCDSSPAPQTCFYTFSKTLNASDSGSLHCAVAACGRVLFGNATKVIVKGVHSTVVRPSLRGVFYGCGQTVDTAAVGDADRESSVRLQRSSSEPVHAVLRRTLQETLVLIPK